MTNDKKLEEKSKKNEMTFRELTISLEKSEREYEKILQEAGLSYEQLRNYIENPENFSPPIWQKVQNEQLQLDAKLSLALKNIKDPRKLKKTFEERGSVKPHWIFVR